MAKWYTLSCPQCQWVSQMPLDEMTVKRFLKEIGEYCRDCRHNKRPDVKYLVKETITNVPGTGKKYPWEQVIPE